MMTRERLRNKFLKSRKIEDRKAFNKQRNNCVSLLRKTKTEFYQNLDEKKILDNRKFWHVVKPYLSSKQKTSDKIILVENNDIIESDEKTADILNCFFSSIVKKLDLPLPPQALPVSDDYSKDPVLHCIDKFRDHPSIVKIKENRNDRSNFSFQVIYEKDIRAIIQNMNPNKASQENDIPVKIMKENIDLFSHFFSEKINNSFQTASFPDCLKNAIITAVFKKGDKSDKNNFRPVSQTRTPALHFAL